MGISFCLAGCVWCEACAGAQSLNAEAAPTCEGSSVLPPAICAAYKHARVCALKRTYTRVRAHSGITFLEMPEPSQGVYTKRCSFEMRVRRREEAA